MIKKIYSNLSVHKKVIGLLVIMLVTFVFFFEKLPLSLAMLPISVAQDGGGYDYSYDTTADNVPRENVSTTTTSATDPVTVDTRYITNGTSVAGYRQYTVQVTGTLWYAWNRGLGGTLYPSSDTSISGWVAGLSDPNVTIGYDFGVYDVSGTNRIIEGSTVPQGTQLVMKFSPYVSDNVFWFGTGYSMDSPYGEWRTNAAATPRQSNKVICDAKDLTQQYKLDYGGVSDTFNVYIPLVMNQPQRSLSNLTGFTCGTLTTNPDGSQSAVCTATAVGSASPTFSYTSTYGKFYYRYIDNRDMTNIGWGGPGCYGNNIPMSSYFGPATGPSTNGDTTIRSPYVLNIPNQNFPYQINIAASTNNPPTAPTMVCPNTVVVGQDITASLTSTDPDGDQVQYATGWFSGVAQDSGWAPLVTSGTVGTLTKTGGYNTTGTKTIYGWAQDSNGALSARSSCDVVVTAVPTLPPTATLDAQTNGGTWVNDPSSITVDPSDTLTLGWRGTDITNCSALAGNDFLVSSISGSDSVTIPAPNGNDVFTITCTGAGGTATDSITVTTRQLPNFTQPAITYTLSPFNTTTGLYDYIDVTFQNTNGGGSNTQANANYQFRYDDGQNGYEVTRTGALGLFTIGQSVNKTERVTNISFGLTRIEVTADNTNAVAETNEGDNVRTLDLTVPPPDPGLTITADRTRVRNDETTTLRWNTAITYPNLTCEVYGPGTTLNPVSLPGTTPTQPIHAKSEYTLKCTEGSTGTVWTKVATVETEGVIEER